MLTPPTIQLTRNMTKLRRSHIIVMTVNRMRNSVPIMQLSLNNISHPIIRVQHTLIFSSPNQSLRAKLTSNIRRRPSLTLIIRLLRLLMQSHQSNRIRHLLNRNNMTIPTLTSLLLNLQSLLANTRHISRPSRPRILTRPPRASHTHMNRRATRQPARRSVKPITLRLSRLQRMLLYALFSQPLSPFRTVR